MFFTVGLEIASIISSLIRLTLSLSVFSKITRGKGWILFPAHFFGIGEAIFESNLNFFYRLFIITGSRVMILGFFAALMAEEWWVIWIFILSHCLLMALLFRPQKYDAETAREITWMRKFFLSLSLVFTQVFTYLPFKRNHLPA